MIYAKHDFTINFLNAVGNEDKPMMLDIIADEIARIIVDDKTCIVKIMRKNGVNATYGTNNVLLANMLSKALQTNKELAKDISSLIISKNVNETDVSNHFNFIDTDNPVMTEEEKKKAASAPKKTFMQRIKEIISDAQMKNNLAGIVNDAIVTGFAKPKSGDISEAGAILAERVRLNEMTSGFATIEKKRQRNKKIIKYSVVAAVLIVGAFFAYRKYKKYKESKGVGGSGSAPISSEMNPDGGIKNTTTNVGNVIAGSEEPIIEVPQPK